MHAPLAAEAGRAEDAIRADARFLRLSSGRSFRNVGAFSRLRAALFLNYSAAFFAATAIVSTSAMMSATAVVSTAAVVPAALLATAAILTGHLLATVAAMAAKPLAGGGVTARQGQTNQRDEQRDTQCRYSIHVHVLQEKTVATSEGVKTSVPSSVSPHSSDGRQPEGQRGSVSLSHSSH